MLRRNVRLGLACLLVSLLAPAAQAAEPADHPLVGRYAGSELLKYRHTAFDEYLLALGPLKGGEYEDARRIEGEVTWIGYRNPGERSTLEIFRNYEQKLADGGFETLWKCERMEACGGRRFGSALFDRDPEQYLHAGDSSPDESLRHLAAKKSTPEGDVYAQITVYDNGYGPWTRVRVIETEAMDTGQIEVIKADEMAAQIESQGSVSLYGIYFDTDSAKIKPESKPTLDEIAKLLESNPDLELLVVGHTDNQGPFDYNIDLSKRRAGAVAEALTSDYGIDRGRLKPWGVGFTAPAATNATEEGRAKNRRVELVQR